MRRILVAIVTLFSLVFSPAAAQVDVSSMGLEELRELRAAIDARITEMAKDTTEGAAQLSTLPAAKVEGLGELIKLARAKDTKGEFRYDLLYYEGRGANEYAVNAKYTRLTGEFFFGYIRQDLQEKAYSQIRIYGDGAPIYEDWLSASSGTSNDIKELDVDIMGYDNVRIEMWSTSGVAYLSNVLLHK